MQRPLPELYDITRSRTPVLYYNNNPEAAQHDVQLSGTSLSTNLVIHPSRCLWPLLQRGGGEIPTFDCPVALKIAFPRSRYFRIVRPARQPLRKQAIIKRGYLDESSKRHVLPSGVFWGLSHKVKASHPFWLYPLPRSLRVSFCFLKTGDGHKQGELMAHYCPAHTGI
jgi:hypothetical protein